MCDGGLKRFWSPMASNQTMAQPKLCSLLCTTFCAITLAQSSGQGVISGIVVEASSGDPVRRAVVTVTWQGTPRSWATTRTDGAGRFVFEGLPPGKYDLRANKAGLGTAIYGANSVRELGDLITLGAGETRGDLKLRFLRFGSISGRVVDHDGDPVQNVEVVLLRSGRNLGERILLNYRGSTSNDRGEYRIPSIDPGEYYVLCRPDAPRQPGLVQQQILVQQYYGGTRDPKDAKILALRGAEVLTGIDFHLTAARPAKITGRVAGVPQLDPPENVDGPTARRAIDSSAGAPRSMRMNQGPFVTIELSPAEGTQSTWTQSRSVSGPDFQFDLPEVAPGRYRIQASINPKGKTYSASQVVSAVEGRTDVVLTVVPAVAVKGQLKVEGTANHPAASFTVALAPPGSGPRRESHSSPVGKDGSFVIENVPPGEWLLNINPNPGATFDKSVRLGDKDFLFKLIDIPPGLDEPLNIIISSNTGTVEGEIDAGGADARRAGILLGPLGDRHTLARFYYSAIADDTGKFKMTGIAPGKYKIFALEKIATATYRNPESLDLLDALGDELEVGEGA
jgi:protocatechuate 3,4-dioxygenase beta subunit